jgi:hypothetical protein
MAVKAVGMWRHSMQNEAMKGASITIVKQRREPEDPSYRRVIADPVDVKSERSIKIMSPPQTECQEAMTLRAVVVSPPPELQGTGEAKLKLLIENRSSKGVNGITDQSGIRRTLAL